jgi:hypothetical protein
MRTIENHVESCHCWECGGYGKVAGDESPERVYECTVCYGEGERYRAKLTQTTVIRAFLTQAEHALEDIELLDTDIDRIYGKIDDVIGDIERYERKVGTR